MNKKIDVYIDEAGRGCFAGELVVCGIMIVNDNFEAFDSKKLSSEKRKMLKKEIEANVDKKIVIVSPQFIDENGLSNALNYALNEIINYFGKDKTYLYDGNNKFGIENENFFVEVKADDKYKGVSAASILAKEKKDELMLKHHKKYPQYQWNKNFGYATKEHIEAVKKYGLSPLHRKSYKIKELDEFFNAQKISILF